MFLMMWWQPRTATRSVDRSANRQHCVRQLADDEQGFAQTKQLKSAREQEFIREQRDHEISLGTDLLPGMYSKTSLRLAPVAAVRWGLNRARATQCLSNMRWTRGRNLHRRKVEGHVCAESPIGRSRRITPGTIACPDYKRYKNSVVTSSGTGTVG